MTRRKSGLALASHGAESFLELAFRSYEYLFETRNLGILSALAVELHTRASILGVSGAHV